MDDAAVGFVEELRRHFRELKDPRVQNRCDHRLMDIIALVMLGTLAGAEDWPDFELFGTERRDWLGTFLELPGGTRRTTRSGACSVCLTRGSSPPVCSLGRRPSTKRPAAS